MKLTKEAMYAEVGKFTRNFTLLTLPDEVSPGDGVPGVWVEMLRSQEGGEKTWAGSWEPFRALLPCVLDFLEHKVQGVCVMRESGKPPSLLYFYSSKGEDYYQGWAALGDAAPDDPRRIWVRLPPKLREFYATLHNGWTTISFMGPVPFGDIAFLSDFDGNDDWPEEVNTQLPFRLENAATVFNNGAGDHIGLDLSLDTPEDHALVWWHEDVLEPDLELNFWDLMDAWICGQLEDVDLAE